MTPPPAIPATASTLDRIFADENPNPAPTADKATSAAQSPARADFPIDRVRGRKEAHAPAASDTKLVANPKLALVAAIIVARDPTTVRTTGSQLVPPATKAPAPIAEFRFFWSRSRRPVCPANSELVSKIAQTTQDGFIWIDDRNATTVPGLFAAGDVTTSFGEQILIAIGDGARAGLSAYDYLLAHAHVPEAVEAE